MPRVSVVIPAYNRVRTLPLCLDSVARQTRTPDEVIVVDDASTDGTADLAASLGATVVRLPVNGGVSVARNAGVAASSGEVLFFLDSDEALAEHSIANALELLAGGYGVVHGVIAPEPLIDDGPVEWYKTLHAYFWRKRGAGEVPTAFFAQAAMPRHVFDEVGPFKPELRDSEDLEYSERLAPRHRILLTDRISARHDEEHRLWPMLREQFRRSLLLGETLFAARRSGRTSLTANRPLGILAVGLMLVALGLSLLSPWSLVAAAGFLALFTAADPGLLSFVARRKGIPFLLYFLCLHLLTHVALVAGAVVGLLRLRGVRVAVATGMVVAAAVAVVLLVRHDRAVLSAALARPRALPLALLALVANAVGLWLGMLSWRALLGRRIPALAAGRIFFLGQLSKYLPGRVWGVVTHIELGRPLGMDAARMTTAYLMSLGITTLTGFVVGLLAAPLTYALAAPVAVLLVLLLWPALLTAPVGWVARRVGKPVEPLPGSAVRAGVLTAVISWLASGVHLWAVAVALGAEPARAALPSAGAFALATVAGSLVLIVPDGWGVREVAIVGALATVLPPATAAAAAVASRIVCVLAELTTSLAVLGTSKLSTKETAHAV
ncbi:glycosyltransferase [Hamadaea tsunoensis]|uniref:glycosyltransferase n=1 Tax=Hamadaea tsunoensis TaxID=53368 RepID=UPI000A035514|nr:glycosyltransferase [Hamadaea tsunoensis]